MLDRAMTIIANTLNVYVCVCGYKCFTLGFVNA